MARFHLVPWPIVLFVDIILDLEFKSPCDCDSADCSCDCHLVNVTFIIDVVLDVKPSEGNDINNREKEEERRYNVVYLKLDLDDEDPEERGNAFFNGDTLTDGYSWEFAKRLNQVEATEHHTGNL
jgi:hypothetical protein